MKTEVEKRKQAMLMYHLQHLTKAEICRQLHCTRPWLDRWIRRYNPGQVERSLQDQKAGPKQAKQVWSETIRQQVIEMRQQRCQQEDWRYAFHGALAIHLELKALESPEVPPARTIHNWFVAANLIHSPVKAAEPDAPKLIPIPVADRVNQVQQLDLKGPVYLEGDGRKYYVVVLRDRFSHRCALGVLDNREARIILEFLISSWQWLGLPVYLQMDNALEFRGSNRYPRSFGAIVRVALDLGLEPVFNPAHEPWRNGGVEWFNGFIDTHLLQVKFKDVEAFRAETKVCQDTCNRIHRSPELDGLTPDEVSTKTDLRLLPQEYQRHLRSSLPQDHGFVSFVRKVRNSGRITLGATDRFMVDPNLAREYVLARVDLALKVVSISYQNQVIRTYDFSADTIGAWAEDDKPKEVSVDNEIVKEQH